MVPHANAVRHHFWRFAPYAFRSDGERIHHGDADQEAPQGIRRAVLATLRACARRCTGNTTCAQFAYGESCGRRIQRGGDRSKFSKEATRRNDRRSCAGCSCRICPQGRRSARLPGVIFPNCRPTRFQDHTLSRSRHRGSCASCAQSRCREPWRREVSELRTANKAVTRVSQSTEFVPLIEPEIKGNEWKYVKECLDTNWVSSVGSYVDRFERCVAEQAGTEYAIATVNGTAALHIALILADVRADDEVLVSSLTFIAPANAIRYIGAWPVFIDAEPKYWHLSSSGVIDFLENGCRWDGKELRNLRTGRRVKAILP